MENKKFNMSDTMEIDAILDEVRRSHLQYPVSHQNVSPRITQAKPQNAQQKISNTQRESTVIVSKSRGYPQERYVDIESSFIIYDDEAELQSSDNIKIHKIKKSHTTDKSQKTKKSQNSNNGKKGKKSGLTLAVIVAAFVFICSAGFCAYSFFGNFTYASSVYVNGVCIGGMTEKEAKERLTKEEEKLLNDFNVSVTSADKSTTLTKDDIKACTFNTDKVLRQAKRYSKDNKFSSDKQEYRISMAVNDETLESVAQKVSKELKQDAANAKVTEFDSSKSGVERFTFEDEKIGVEVNKDGFEKQFKSFLSDGNFKGEIQADSNNTEPKITKEYLENNIKELSSYSTVASSSASENSKANMKLAATMCNNSIIDPSEIWSFNNCTGDSNLESNGYKVAGVLVNGQSAMGVGGGICQTSTTIYNAALYCGLHVQERRPHAIPSSYVPMGLDATIDYGNIDLKLKNTFDYQLFMECYMEGSTVVCKFYGLENPDFDEVDVVSTPTSATTAVASRTFYKNGQRVTGENLPDEDLPPSTYDGSGGSSSSPSIETPESQQSSTTAEEVIPTPEPQPTPDLTPQPPVVEPDIPFEPDYDDTTIYYY